MGGKVNSSRFMVGKSETKRPLARPKLRVEDNTHMYLEEI
jgi:hypothetical protein